ncbi:MAG: translation initiation factor [Lentisphaeria bacterium]|nr:translation initiation factor [Lentisphaeria bacterium]
MMSKRKKKTRAASDKEFAEKEKVNNPFGDISADLFAGNKPSEALPEPLVNEAVERPKPTLYIRFEKKGRGGKTVTIIEGFENMDMDELMLFSSTIRKKLGCGGSVYESVLELQGDIRKRAADYLLKEGYRLKGEIP